MGVPGDRGSDILALLIKARDMEHAADAREFDGA